MNKKIISVLAILATLTCALFAASTRKDIDAFLKQYETFVVKAEKAAASNKISDLMSMSLESVKLTEKYDKIKDSKEWTTADSTKYLKLTNRYTKAASKVTSDLSDNTDALLNAFSF